MLKVEQLEFFYAKDLPILKNINFQVNRGEFISVLGESGSGKSTLLKLVYGLEEVVSGRICFEDKLVTGPKFNLIPGHPDMKLVPQEFDLLDFVTVEENVGKYLSNFDIPLKKQTIEKALEVVNLLDFKAQFPNKLSGGQRQRVAIARAIATSPKLLLLDEPYSHLDQPLKFELRKNIWNWAKNTGCTVFLTTHDAKDALGFSNQIMIMKNGAIEQYDTPENLRNNPVNEYVASLLGEYVVLKPKEMKDLFGIEISESRSALIYPEELEIQSSGNAFQILQSFYQGRDYLVEVMRNDVILKFYSKSIPESNFVSLNLNQYRLI